MYLTCINTKIRADYNKSMAKFNRYIEPKEPNGKLGFLDSPSVPARAGARNDVMLSEVEALNSLHMNLQINLPKA